MLTTAELITKLATVKSLKADVTSVSPFVFRSDEGLESSDIQGSDI